MELARVFIKYPNRIKTTQNFLCCISFLPRNVHTKTFSIHSVSEPRKATLAGGRARREARLQLHLAAAAAFLAARSGTAAAAAPGLGHGVRLRVAWRRRQHVARRR